MKKIKKIPFYKMSGSGNDFIIIDNRKGIVDENLLPEFAVKVCSRRMSAGADGLVLVEESEWGNFKWRFYNSDGSMAEMCGNAARCVARFTFLNKITGPYTRFETEVGLIPAEVKKRRVKIQMIDPEDFRPGYEIDMEEGKLLVSSIRVGVPHVVVRAENIDLADVVETGRRIRFHEAFGPAGTNADFVCANADGSISLRTYERGVEDETLACGTGAIAAALVTAHSDSLPSPVTVVTRSGERLLVYFEREGDRFYKVHLEGEVRVIYAGELWEEAWTW